MPIVLKSGILNLLEPSGPIQACNGVALPIIICYSMLKKVMTCLRIWIVLCIPKCDFHSRSALEMEAICYTEMVTPTHILHEL